MRFEWTVAGADANRRLDRFLLSRLKEQIEGLSSSRIQRMLRKGDVKVNGLKARGGLTLRPGDVVVAHHSAPETALRTPTESHLEADSTPAYQGPTITVLHEAQGFLVVDKPAGVTCDHGEGGAPGLLTWARERYQEDVSANRVRPAAAHRLDRGTTGAICLGLTAEVLEIFRRAQEEHRVHKLYWVVVWGRPLEREFELEIPLLRLAHSKRRGPKVVPAVKDQEGLPARTRFRWIAAGPASSLLQAEVLTGRTHQIRAHCKAHGLPVVGDPRYGDPDKDEAAKLRGFLDHQLLHAKSLELEEPAVGFAAEADLPAEFRRALKHLRIELTAD